ncbi:MAG: shikimate dehydrogenase, partial [Clostridia bacterium]|nr:shikimate dehydrogenase [Clostridia bacterium]
MKYGLIGEKLGHSFSKEIHESIADLEYELCEVAPSELEGFMTQRGFSAVNVTIPYKEAVIPYLDVTDTAARDIGAVNTVVNRDGRLYGYNTDFFGMKSLICRLGLDLSGSTVLILGTGGTSKTASAVARELGAANIVKVSRKGGNGAVTYAEAAEKYRDADFIINTTPVGMFPNVDGSAVDLSDYPCLRGVIDAVYNPLRTDLILDATARSIPAEGGLYMLVAQAVRASELFTGDDRHGVTDKIFAKMLSKKENIFLTGMPGVGKTTVGHQIEGKTGREFIDTDEQIIKKTG